jgi:trk system potassium uptake protein TrkH
LSLVLLPGVASLRFAQSGIGDSDIVGGTKAHARRTAVVYIALTAAALLATLAAGIAPFEALLHVFTAVSTAGFSSHPDSIAALPWAGQAVLIAAGLLGAVSFALYHRLTTRHWRQVWRDAELLTLLACCLLFSVVLVLVLGTSGQASWSDAALRGPLLAISAQSTTGFEPIAPATLDPGAKLVLSASMLIGGDVGSTAGGIKIIRLLVILGLLRLAMLRTALPPHAYADLRVTGRRLEPEALQRALAVILMFLLTAAASWLVFLLAGAPAIDALFEVISALGTVGLSAGISAPDLAPGLKLLLCLDMVAGRVEIIALLVLIYPPTWIGRGR